MEETLTCAACAHSFTWVPGSSRRPRYCRDLDCRRQRANRRAQEYLARKRGIAPPIAVRAPAGPPPPEPTHVVERLLAAAKRRRQRLERLHGRTYTITTGWMQRPGAGDINGNADEQGWGFA